jgi:hypothetical protein
MRLTINMRVQTLQGQDAVAQQPNKQWADTLLQVGNGETGSRICIPDHMVVQHNGQPSTDPQHLIHDIYGDFIHEENRAPEHLLGRAILTPTNECVEDLNNMALNSFPGEQFIHLKQQ